MPTDTVCDWLLNAAVINADVSNATAVVVTGNTPVVCPAAILTVAGTLAAPLDDDRTTLIPPTGAGPDIVIVPVVDTPPATDWLFSVTELTKSGFTVRGAMDIDPFSVAEIFTACGTNTFDVLTSNVAANSPAATVIATGTLTAPLFDDSAIVRPPTGAGSERVIVAVTLFPPVMLAGSVANDAIEGAFTVRLLVLSMPFADAVMVDVTSLATDTVVAWKVADVCPAAIVTDAGIVTLSLDDDSVTT